MTSQRALRHSNKGTAERLRQIAIENRHPAGVKEPVFPVSQEAIREAIAAQLCPWCGRGPFAMLPVHTNKTHGVDKWELRELAGYTTADPLCSAEARSKMAAAYDLEQGVKARAAAAAKTGKRTQRRTTAGIRRNVESITSWAQANPEAAAEARARALEASKTPAAMDRRSDGLRAHHAIHPPSPERVREFEARMASPEARAKREAALTARRQGHGTTGCYKRGCRCADCRAAKAAARR